MIGRLTVCKKYPIPSNPARGEKSALNSLNYLTSLSGLKVLSTLGPTISKLVVPKA